ncbi:MAG: hypothetical protein KIT28_11465, partial [Rubrivivax sp.]|nr:hypothetical protein [Rubrivivax sp.]
QLLPVDDRQPPLLGLRGVDQHALHHVSIRRAAFAAAARSCWPASRCGVPADTMQEQRVRTLGANRRGPPDAAPAWAAGAGSGSVGACVSARRASRFAGCRGAALHRGQRPCAAGRSGA